MKKLGCRDIGGDDDFVATGETNQEVIDKIYAHSQEAHPEKMAAMSETEKQAMNAKMEELLNQQA